MKKLFLIIIGLLSVATVRAQLVNIETKRIQSDSVRFVLSDGINVKYNDLNGKKLLQIENTLACQVKSKSLKDIFLFLNNYKLIRKDGSNYLNVFFTHFRYNRKLSDKARFESFVQYQSNPVFDINSRVILGTGLRLKAVNRSNFWAYVGTTYMLEFEDSHKYHQSLWQHRSSSYLSFTTQIPESRLTFTGTMYYQPLFKTFKDYRFLSEVSLDYKLSDKIALSTGVDYLLDSQTPAGIRQYYFHSKLGLKLLF